MAEALPTVTILIAARPGQAEIKAVNASRDLRYPAEKLEIIVARGRQPSAQRNAAMKSARGEWIYFLDDDSVPDAENLLRASGHFSRPEVKMVGGPNLCPPGAPPIERLFALVLASWLAFGPSRARYASVGRPRATSEKELILCNLLARRSAMLELGGFNEALYPNEENALMDELQKRGGKLVYDPDVVVYRRPRATLWSFGRMLRTYGRGRAEQFRLHPTPGSSLNFVPPLFCVYLVVLAGGLICFPQIGKYLLVPLAVYVLALLVQGLALIQSPGGSRGDEAQIHHNQKSNQDAGSKPRQAGYNNEEGVVTRVVRGLAAVPLVVASHILYGLGFWVGLFTKLRPSGAPAPGEVVLEKLQ